MRWIFKRLIFLQRGIVIVKQTDKKFLRFSLGLFSDEKANF